MQEVFEKIIEKLKSESHWTESTFDEDGYCNDDSEEVVYLHNAIEIVKQEAENYNNGWIPCSDRLPEDDSICIVTVEYPNHKTMVDYGWFDRKNVCWFVGTQEFRTSNILAWQPLPQPYQQKGE